MPAGRKSLKGPDEPSLALFVPLSKMATLPIDATPATADAASVKEQDSTIGSEEQAGAAPIRNVSRFTRIYRSPLFNVILVGLISFTQPGIWNALNSESAPSSTDKRHRSWRRARAVPRQWRQLAHLRSNGVRLLDLCRACKQDWSEKGRHHRYAGLCTILGGLVCQQSVRD